MAAALEVRDLVWAPRGAEAPVIDGAAFDVEDRSLTVMIGPSGCGKSSLGYLVAGLLTPDAGSVSLHGEAVRKPAPDRLMVYQESALWPWMTVRENVGFGPVARGEAGRREAGRAADALLEKFGLLAFADRYPGQLSGGMKRRVDIAQALINRPRLLILDEPFRGLDVMTRELMQEYYLGVFEENRVTTLFISSEVEEAVFLGDRVLVAGQGGRIAETVEIDLPRPRREEHTASETFQALRERLLDAIDRASGEAAVA